MSLSAGSVVVPVAMHADGSANLSGSGIALLWATALVAARTPANSVPLPTVGQTTTPFFPAAPCTAAMIASRIVSLQAVYDGAATEANHVATAFVSAVETGTVTVPATGIDDSGGHACTGTATGTIS